MCLPAGQLTYATPELRTAHGFPATDDEVADLLHGPPPRMLVEVTDISNCFWSQTKWGMAMQDHLSNHPFRRHVSTAVDLWCLLVHEDACEVAAGVKLHEA